tara:strand:- start:970 stop:1419 length:450 start_codon:yes stop_codon:yes gene_type:complete
MKTEEPYIYDGLGFPVRLDQVDMVLIDGEWLPKIDIQAVADKAILALGAQEQRLTGNQLKFIRSYFSMALRQFAETVVNESHTAVSKWEKFGDDITNMDINIEKIIRLYIFEHISEVNADKGKHFLEQYKGLRNISLVKTAPKNLVLAL